MPRSALDFFRRFDSAFDRVDSIGPHSFGFLSMDTPMEIKSCLSLSIGFPFDDLVRIVSRASSALSYIDRSSRVLKK